MPSQQAFADVAADSAFPQVLSHVKHGTEQQDAYNLASAVTEHSALIAVWVVSKASLISHWPCFSNPSRNRRWRAARGNSTRQKKDRDSMTSPFKISIQFSSSISILFLASCLCLVWGRTSEGGEAARSVTRMDIALEGLSASDTEH